MKDKCLGHQRITAGTLAAATAPTIPAGTREMWVQCDTAPVRMTLEGTTPTATVGMRVVQNLAPIKISIDMGMHLAKFILESSTPNLDLTYFGQSDT